jgi:NADH:ubiquinone oxidoreductase subunit
MVYILDKTDEYFDTFLHSVWEVDNLDVDNEYKRFMLKKASPMGITINPHWLNIMNHKDHHSDLSEKEYKMKSKAWDKVRREWPIDRFLEEVLGGKKMEFKRLEY